MGKSDYTEYIARISYGKDSLKMLDVIISRGLPLDRITTTDVWATDTISANLPEMDAFKARMDERIWWKYRMEVEHLCARNKDGSKKTYEQMFYHVPQRRSQSVQVERERRAPARLGSGLPSPRSSVVPINSQTKYEVRGTGHYHRVPSQYRIQLLPETQNCPNPTSRGGRSPMEHCPGVRSSKSGQRIQGFPAQ